MEVISRGVNPDTVPKDMKCYHCNTVLRYVPSDVHHDQRDGSYVICPVCGKYLATSFPSSQYDR
jgi:transcription elongation factor Elf1